MPGALSDHQRASPWRNLWLLDPAVTYLNHGAFGACPRAVLEAQALIRERMETQPMRFFVSHLEPELDAARRELARFVGADAEDLAFVPNATSGVNTVLRSLSFRPGHELLATSHEYNACRNALDFTARASGAAVVLATIPFPIASPEEVVEAVLSRVTPRTRLALIDHVTSQTGLVFPVAPLVKELDRRGVDTLVDGAHAPGMLPLDLDQLGAAYYAANCHKWLCSPKGAAFLHVRRDRRDRVHPLIISHGANVPLGDRSRFRLLFDWTGTIDPSPYLAVPEAIRFLESLLPGGFSELLAANRSLALTARKALTRALGIPPPCPEEMIGSLAALPLPDAGISQKPWSPLDVDPLQVELLGEHGIEVPIITWPSPPKRLLRISAQVYNCEEEYDRLAAVLVALLGDSAAGGRGS